MCLAIDSRDHALQILIVIIGRFIINETVHFIGDVVIAYIDQNENIFSTDGFINRCFAFAGTKTVACGIYDEIIRNISLKSRVVLGNILDIFTKIDKIVIDTVPKILGRIHNDKL